MRTRTKTRTRINRPARRLALASLAALALVPAVSAQKPAKKEPPHAVIAGTVFRDPGFALPGATVVLTRKDDPKQKKLQEAVSNYRGEFAFHVPPAQATYVVHAKLKGYGPAQQDVDVNGEAEFGAALVLTPESK